MSGEKCKIIIWDILSDAGSLKGRIDAISRLSLSEMDKNACLTKKFFSELTRQLNDFYGNMGCCGISDQADDPS